MANVAASHVGALVGLFDGFAQDVGARLPKLEVVQLQNAPEAFAAGLRRDLQAAKGVLVTASALLEYDMEPRYDEAWENTRWAAL